MASQITPTYNFIFGFLSCDLPEDTIDTDLKNCMIRGIHTYKEDRDSQINKFRP